MRRGEGGRGRVGGCSAVLRGEDKKKNNGVLLTSRSLFSKKEKKKGETRSVARESAKKKRGITCTLAGRRKREGSPES